MSINAVRSTGNDPPRIISGTLQDEQRFTLEHLIPVMQDIINGRLTPQEAARKYNISQQALQRHLTYLLTREKNKSRKFTKRKKLREKVLSAFEQRLGEALTILQEWGFRLTKEDVREMIEDIIKLTKAYEPFAKSMIQYKKITNFCEQNCIQLKKAESWGPSCGDPFVIADYFESLRRASDELGIIDKPGQMWNATETTLDFFQSTTNPGVGLKVTLFTIVNAEGTKLSSALCFQGERYDKWIIIKKVDNLEKGTYEMSHYYGQKGCNLFQGSIMKVLIPHVGKNRPIFILYDGRITNIDIPIVEFALKQNIRILRIPSQMSQRLQPLQEIFETWEDEIIQWQILNAGINVPIEKISEFIADVWYEAKPEMIVSGFKTAGIYPFNSVVVPEEDYDSLNYNKWKHSNMTHQSVKSSSQVLHKEPVTKTVQVLNQEVSSEHSYSIISLTDDSDEDVQEAPNLSNEYNSRPQVNIDQGVCESGSTVKVDPMDYIEVVDSFTIEESIVKEEKEPNELVDVEGFTTKEEEKLREPIEVEEFITNAEVVNVPHFDD